MMIRILAVLGVVVARGAWAGPALERDTLPVPPVPLAAARPVALPPVPSFALPPVEAGVHDVRELRVRGHGLLGLDLTVKGYITWIYDCVAALARPNVRPAQTRLLVDDHPELCERPAFYLGAEPAAAKEAALWVVDVPRPPNKRERAMLSVAQLEARPRTPHLALGALVAVDGTFALRSPHGEQSSDGLLMYRALHHLPPSARPAPAVVVPSSPRPLAPAIVTTPPLRAVVPVWQRNESIDHYERCNDALTAGQHDAAAAACREAVTAWRGNHLAWYALGNAHASRGRWSAAREAYERAAQLRPDQAMYQLYAGVAGYEVAIRQLRDEPAQMDDPSTLRAIAQDVAATRLALKPYRLAAALAAARPSATLRFDRARRALSAAAQLAPRLWLAHDYLGRIYREQDDPAAAAEAYGHAIEADPSQAGPYVALVELYRAWGFHDQGVAVARQGLAHAGDVASLWYELGMAYDAKRLDGESLAAFDHAIAVRGASSRARLQRGQIYLRRHELAAAKRDLEAFVASAGGELAVLLPIARGLLREIARQEHGAEIYLRMPKDVSRQ